ncbi:FAD-dependent oxidoreductase [Salimicrobium halophilum]|uniref:NADPH-dependent 2,4-dienoyl-CoA reductase, sulfur reductase n=1 Tax=Salimicrobium halophilum TaxID=86666 RepID=A0A1G8VRK4_9BACI|nr:FAD-dependent oxidoreductase [Salimicrobium halophilum]SDJ68517.1 NADPH-dependent 2,4-dienoyl-CoA reductase, sulfur reductase [Salimicrobium halophilum]
MKLVVIGGDAAGMSAAMQVVRNTENPEIVVLERGEIYSYGQCGLPYVIGGDVSSTDDLIARKVETFREKYGIDARINHEVTSVDCDKRMVYGTDGKGEDFEESYDELLVASGASPVVPPWKGRDLEGVHVLKTIPDVEKIVEDTDGDVTRVTVIGSGYIGLEVAENFKDIGKDVHLISRSDHPASMVDEDMGEMIAEEARKQGVHLTLRESVERLEGDDRVGKVVTDKGEYETDLVIVATGVAPNVGFMTGTGVHTTESGAIEVNRFMETNLPHIYAAGDCAVQYHRIKERNDYVPLGTHANKQGRIAGLVLSGKRQTFKGIVGTSVLKFFDLTIGKTGLSEEEAKKENIPYETVFLKSTHAAGYYTDEPPMSIKMTYQPETQQVLGIQIVGTYGVDKRIDVIATALYHEMKTDDLLDLDLAYAPPYNSVWDPVQQAARRIK